MYIFIYNAKSLPLVFVYSVFSNFDHLFLTSRVSLLASLAGFLKGSAYMSNTGTSDLFYDLSGNEVGVSLLQPQFNFSELV